MERSTAALLARLAPFVVLLGHAALYGHWIVDDAAITFSYARSVAEGHGFVTWPGAEPVEGFSNPAWLLGLVPFLWLGLFDPVWTPKLLGLAMACSALLLLRRVLVRSSRGELAPVVADLALVFVVANPAVVIWCVSGLENPLYLLAVAGLVEHASRTTDWNRRGVAVAAAWALLATTTRPDGLAFAAVWPLSVLLDPRAGERPRRVVLALQFSALVAAGVAALTLWRYGTFGDVLPNTARVKMGSDRALAQGLAAAWYALALGSCAALRSRSESSGRTARHRVVVTLLFVAIAVLSATALPAEASGTLRSALRALAAPGLGVVLLGLALERTAIRRATTTEDPGPAPMVTILTAAFVVLALPSDWMGEQRFATPLLALTGAFGFQGVAELADSVRRSPHRLARRLFAAALLASVAVSGTRFVRRGLAFANAPTVPMQKVQRDFEATFVDWANDLDSVAPTVLIPDVGGALWSHRLPILDLGGLCHAEIGRHLGRGERDAIAELVLTDLRPAFVGMHGRWAWDSGLADDPRFARDYVPIWTGTDTTLSALAGRSMESGRYVRSDLAPPAAVRAAWRRRSEATLRR